MRNLLLLIVLTSLFCSCASTGKMTNEALHYGLVGQDETTIYSRLGPPTRTATSPDEGKIMIYEFYSKGMFETPYKSKVTYSTKRNILGDPQGLTFNSGSTVTNDSKYTVYQKEMSYLKLFLNKDRNCTRFEENLTKDQLKMYYEQFKCFIPKNQ